MDCSFERIGEDLVCKTCGFSIKTTVQADSLHKRCDGKKKEYPSLFQMGVNLFNSAVDFVKDGGKLVDEEEQERRLGVCKTCPEYDAEQNRCMQCGCFLSLKVRLNSGGCPLNHW